MYIFQRELNHFVISLDSFFSNRVFNQVSHDFYKDLYKQKDLDSLIELHDKMLR